MLPPVLWCGMQLKPTSEVAYSVQLKWKSVGERTILFNHIYETDKYHTISWNPVLYKKRMEVETKLDFLMTHSVKHLLFFLLLFF